MDMTESNDFISTDVNSEGYLSFHSQELLKTALSDLSKAEERASLAEDANKKWMAKIEDMKQIVDRMAQDLNEPSPDHANNVVLENVTKLKMLLEGPNIAQQSTESKFDEPLNHKYEASVKVELMLYSIMQEKTVAFMNKQSSYKEEMSRLDYGLCERRELSELLTWNVKRCPVSQLNEMNGEYEQDISDLEGEVLVTRKILKTTEDEDDQIVLRLQIEQMEKKIIDTRCKILSNEKTIAENQFRRLKIESIQEEISQLIEAKANLRREMQMHGCKFRSWKRARRTEILHLQSGDCNLEKNIIQQRMKCSKQRNMQKSKEHDETDTTSTPQQVEDVKMEQEEQYNTIRREFEQHENGVTVSDHSAQIEMSFKTSDNKKKRVIECNHGLPSYRGETGVGSDTEDSYESDCTETSLARGLKRRIIETTSENAEPIDVNNDDFLHCLPSKLAKLSMSPSSKK